MKKSTSATTLHAKASPSLRRVSLSCNALPDLASQPPHEDNMVLYTMAKAPLTQVYQCLNANPPPLASESDSSEATKSLAACIAAPPDPIEDPIRRNLFAYQMQTSSLERFEVWYNRLVRNKRNSDSNL